MIFEKHVLEVVEDEFGRAILVAVYLFEDDPTLLVHLVLRVGAAEDDVGEQLQCSCKVLLEECRVDDRLLLIGEGIEVAPYILHAVEDVPCPSPCGALEEHVLHKVCQPILLGAFVACASIDGISAVDYRCGRGVVYDAQPIGEGCRGV